MKLVHVLGLCAVAGFALTGCGGVAPSEAPPEGVISPATEVDPGTWVSENCSPQGWYYQKQDMWVFTRVAVVPNSELSDPDEKSREYAYDELADNAQLIGFTQGPVCFELGVDGDTMSVEDASSGDTVHLTRVKTPRGDAWVTGMEYRVTYSPSAGNSEVGSGSFTPVNEFNDLTKVEIVDDAPDFCVAAGCA